MTEPRRPDPEPLRTDEVRVVAIGTGLFALGLVVSLVLHGRLEEQGRGSWVWVMACGVLLGLIGLRTVRRRRVALRRGLSAEPTTHHADDDPR